LSSEPEPTWYLPLTLPPAQHFCQGPKEREARSKNGMRYFTKICVISNQSSPTRTTKPQKKQGPANSQEWGKYYQISGKGCISSIYKELLLLNNRHFFKDDIAKKHMKNYSIMSVTREMQIKP
jgi:hypothetical protein